VASETSEQDKEPSPPPSPDPMEAPVEEELPKAEEKPFNELTTWGRLQRRRTFASK